MAFYNHNIHFRYLSSDSSRTASRCHPRKTFLLVAAFALSLMVIGGGGAEVQHAVKLGQVVASDPTPYHLTGDAWSILDLSAPQSGYAFAQTLGTSLTDGAFVTTWRTTSADKSITLPLIGSGMTVDWGDGNTTTASGSVSHTYNTAGDYTVQIIGGLTGFHLNGATDASKLVSIDQWGTASWTYLQNAFRGAKNMVYNAGDVPNFSGVNDMSSMFFFTPSFNGNLSSWDVSSVTDMSNMFTLASSFNGNLSSWDVSSVTDMKRMFNDAASFNQPLNSWDVSSATRMDYMFRKAVSFNQPLNSWDVSSATGMSNTFQNITSFDQNLGNWYVTLDSDTIADTAIPGVVGTISAQNLPLRKHSPTYAIVDDDDLDADHFEIVSGNRLNMTSGVPGEYSINVTASGTNVFESGNNWRVLEIDVTGQTTDTTPPTVTSLTTSEQSPTNSADAGFTVTFSEDVTFAGDILVTGGTASPARPTGTASSFTFTVAPTSDGVVTVRIPSGVAGDNAGNANSESNTASLTFDHTVPTIQSLTTNEQSPTNSADAGFTVTFSEDVTFAGDILVTGGTASPARPTGTASSFTFTVAPTSDGVVTVRIPSGVAGDNAGNANSESNTASLTFDHTVPTIQSLTTNEQSPTNSADAGFTVTFSEDVTFTGDILVTGGTASPARPTGTASSFTFTVAPTSDGVVTVRIPSGVAGDNAGNANSESNTASLTFDHTVPTIQSLTTNEQSPTNSADAGFTVTFSEDVTFTGDILVTGGTANPARPTGTASSFTFTVAPTSDGVVTVQVPAGTAHDDAGNENPASVAPKLTFDRTKPVITPLGSIRLELDDLYVQPAAECSDAIDSNPTVTVTVDDVDVNQVGAYTLTHACTDDAGNLATATSTVIVFDPSGFATTITTDSGSLTNSASVDFTVAFEEELGTDTLVASEIEVSPPVTVSNLTRGLDGTYTFTLSGLTDNMYTVAVPHGVVNSTLGSPNSLASVRVTVDTTVPTVSSIERYNPSGATTDSQTLVYEVTFSEDVTGVDKADFALSPDSTGGTSPSSWLFTQTRSPSLAIPDLQTVSDAITVADSGTVTSVTVAVDITHTYIGDLKIDLVAPDGTTKTLHNRSGGGNDDIDQMYTPDFEGESIAGTWTLRIRDNANSDSGTLNDWTLTINHGSTTTASPVTSVSGSGDTYYATVSATTDGTYNLDLLSSGHDIADAASNLLADASTTGADETYTVSTAVIDDTAPTLESIQRYTPATESTDSQTLVYKATFSENVTGVTASDFTLSSNSTGGESTSTSTGQFTQTRSPNLDIPDLQTVSDTITVSDSETATSVSVEVDITHNYIGDLKIDLIAPDGTTRTLHNRSGGSADNIDQAYTPSFGSIQISGAWKLQINDNYNADPGTLNSWTLTINYGDTATTLSSVTGISGSGDAYYVTVSATQDGTYNLDLLSSGHDIADAASNLLANAFTTGADETYIVSTAVIDDTAPTLESIQRYTPATESTDSQTLVYKATFSENVTGVTASDFTLSSDSAGGENTPASTGQFTQTRSPNLDIPDLQTVSDTITVSDSETATSVSVEVDITHNYIGDLKIDLIAPDGTTRTLHNRSGGSADNIDQAYTPSFGSIQISGAWKLQINDNYNADPGTLNSWTLTINYGDTATTLSSVTGISGSGDAYYVTVSATQDGTYNLDLLSSGHDIADAASNPLANAFTTGADETYIVSTAVIDDTAPTLESIQRYTPATESTDSQTLVYKATFSENVTGVTASDFTLSSDSAGGENTPASTGQFTQTRSPNLDIPDLQTVSDTITVSDSETATSVSVEVDITHNYIGDLKIDLIAPDGTTRTLHNRSGGSADNIDQAYTPSFGSIQISGAWKLQINDNYNADPGTLNSWTLTINYGGTATTLSPVTGISGSGDAYYVTVSATQDGTYNLDLLSSGHDIADAASNPLANAFTTGADETYIVSTAVIDDTAPTLESIQRYTPATESTDSQTLVYKATFSENVTGVTASDFTLSSDSTGGESTSASTGQFTQTRSPNLDIPDLANRI